MGSRQLSSRLICRSYAEEFLPLVGLFSLCLHLRTFGWTFFRLIHLNKETFCWWPGIFRCYSALWFIYSKPMGEILVFLSWMLRYSLLLWLQCFFNLMKFWDFFNFNRQFEVGLLLPFLTTLFLNAYCWRILIIYGVCFVRRWKLLEKLVFDFHSLASSTARGLFKIICIILFWLKRPS